MKERLTGLMAAALLAALPALATAQDDPHHPEGDQPGAEAGVPSQPPSELPPQIELRPLTDPSGNAGDPAAGAPNLEAQANGSQAATPGLAGLQMAQMAQMTEMMRSMQQMQSSMMQMMQMMQRMQGDGMAMPGGGDMGADDRMGDDRGRRGGRMGMGMGMMGMGDGGPDASGMSSSDSAAFAQARMSMMQMMQMMQLMQASMRQTMMMMDMMHGGGQSDGQAMRGMGRM